MENELYRIRLAVEGMCLLMETLVALQHENNQCCRAVILPVEQDTSRQPTPDGEMAAAQAKYNRKEAAAYLLVDPRSVTRYRNKGKLRFSMNENDQICYLKKDLRDCYFWKWGKWPED